MAKFAWEGKTRTGKTQKGTMEGADEAAVMALNGEEVPEMIDTGFHWYDAENIDSDTIAPLLYE